MHKYQEIKNPYRVACLNMMEAHLLNIICILKIVYLQIVDKVDKTVKLKIN